jgi:hypothetical protein
MRTLLVFSTKFWNACPCGGLIICLFGWWCEFLFRQLGWCTNPSMESNRWVSIQFLDCFHQWQAFSCNAYGLEVVVLNAFIPDKHQFSSWARTKLSFGFGSLDGGVNFCFANLVGVPILLWSRIAGCRFNFWIASTSGKLFHAMLMGWKLLF